MKTFVMILALVVLASTAAAAEDCTRETTATLETPAGTYYVIADDCTLERECLLSLWIYQETNGYPGLQSCDEIECDCSGTMESDTIIF